MLNRAVLLARCTVGTDHCRQCYHFTEITTRIVAATMLKPFYLRHFGTVRNSTVESPSTDIQSPDSGA